MDLLHSPHHDGSPIHVGNESPEPGQLVDIRCSTAPGDGTEEVWVRTVTDAEPIFLRASAVEDAVTSTDANHKGGENRVWWQAKLPMHNPVMNYRFLMVADDGTQRWLTAAGVHDHDVPDAFDFKINSHAPAPDWSRDGVVYQIFPDRFARSAAADDRETPAWAVPAGWDDEVIFEGSDPRTPLQFFGGDLDGITEHLDHIAEVGADILYTTPVFPGESNHRYNASTFDRVDPLLGGDEAYQRLATAVHQRGWRILGDLTANHTGDTHEWFTSATGDEQDPHRGWYHFEPDGSYATWMGHSTLPKLNHANARLRAAFTEGPDSVVGRWLRAPYALDGWRIDVANMTGRLREIDLNHEVARTIRRTTTAVREDALVLGEHNHDGSTDVPGDGWHGTMNYSGFSWPVWEWLRADDTQARSFGTPVPVARRTGPQVVASMRMWLARYGWRTFSSSWNILGSHDSARIRTLTGSAARHQVAAGLQFTLPGVPMIFAGDEIGLEGVLGEDSRRPMPWDRSDDWDLETFAVYSALSRLRGEQTALRRGSLRWAYVDDDALVFLREHADGNILVCVRRSPGTTITIDSIPNGDTLLSTGGADFVDGQLRSGDGPSLQIVAV
ncbi:alpha-glycosidase [Nocardioides sp. Soil797]|nr:alpha-glycosidase [Nocardioides sp. Soil797]